MRLGSVLMALTQINHKFFAQQLSVVFWPRKAFFETSDEPNSLTEDRLFLIWVPGSQFFRLQGQKFSATGTPAFQRKDWFISHYMDDRKQWLKKLAEARKMMRREADETDQPNSNLLAIVKYQSRAYPEAPHWASDQTSQTGKPFECSGNVFRKMSSMDTAKRRTPVTFHVIERTVHYGDSSSWPSISRKLFERRLFG